jgi:chemotaxis protein CheD
MSNSTLTAPRPGWVASSPKKSLVVGMGDMLASNDPTATLVTYSLGSCVGVVIYDPVARVGGMLHAMLPDSTINSARAAARPHMFVDTGLPALFHAVYALGGVKARLTVKLAGGAQFLDEKKIFNIGIRNSEMVQALLARNGITACATEIGGQQSRTLRLDLGKGELTVDIPGQHSFLL